MKIITEVEITDQMIEDLIVTAFEGGSNYWMEWEVSSKRKDVKWDSNNYAKQIVDGDIELDIFDVEDDGDLLGKLNMECIKTGLIKMGESYPVALFNIINESWDANDADIFMQLVVLGDIVYG